MKYHNVPLAQSVISTSECSFWNIMQGQRKKKTCTLEVCFLTENGSVWGGCFPSRRLVGSSPTAAAGCWVLVLSAQLRGFWFFCFFFSKCPAIMSWHSEELFLSVCPSVVLGGQLENLYKAMVVKATWSLLVPMASLSILYWENLLLKSIFRSLQSGKSERAWKWKWKKPKQWYHIVIFSS